MRHLSIRTILLLTIGLLTALPALFAAQSAFNDWRRLNRTEALKDAVILSNQLFDAADELALERDLALSVLRAPDAETISDLLPQLKESRRASDDGIARAMAALDRHSFAELTPLKSKIRTRVLVIQKLRAQIDAAMNSVKDGHDRDLSNRWAAEASGLLLETNELLVGFLKHFMNIDPTVTQHLLFKHCLNIISDYAGRNRSMVGRLIVENAYPTPEETAELLEGQGILQALWERSHLLAVDSGLYPAIAPYYTDATSHYSTLHDMLRNLFYLPQAGHGATYPISAGLWFELSTQASDSFNAMKTQARQVTGAYLDGLIADAKRGIVAQGIVLVLAFILCAFSFRVIIFRVIRPINGMVDALMRATRGEPVAIEPRAGLQDEISKLTHVLHVFQQKGEEIRRTSAELSRSQTHLRAVVDYALDGLITTNAIGTVTSFNAASERIFGYPSGEMIGRNIEILMPLATLVVDGPASLNVGPTGPASGEGVARRKDGTVCPVELSVSTFWLEDGQHFSAIIRDIAQRKKAEAQLMHHTHALERSNRELDDFAYIASHDLKEPLRGIHNHSRFLLEDNADKLDQESVGRLNRLVYLTQRMERLINDLLYFSRLGRQELAIQATDIAAVVHDIEATLEQFLQERRARITLPRSLAPVICDKPRVTELLRNLITNAVKYNDKAEKVVEIGGLDRYPTPDGTLARNVFYVKDNGLGIAPEFHDDIFRIFKRLQAAGEGEEGTGVGLTFVKKIVERHGGRIWLESEPGKGTTFYFTLEALEHDAEAGTEAA